MPDEHGGDGLGSLGDGRWVLSRALGAGATASVYQATDTVLGVERAIKVLHPQGSGSAAGSARLMGEARAMALIDHPHVLKVFDLGRDGAREFVVMDLASGGNLARLIEVSGPLAETVALRYGLQILSALAAAHAHGIVHRDVKPHNVLLDDHGVAKLADFGIALHLREDALRATKTGTALGTLAFMAPEQRIDARKVGAQADIYAVGSTLYYLMTAGNPVDLFAATDDARRWEGLSEPVRQILARATRYRPEERYATAGEMAHDIVRALDADDRVQSDPLDPRTFPDPSARLTGERNRVVAAPTMEWLSATDDAITFLLERDTGTHNPVRAVAPPPSRRAGSRAVPLLLALLVAVVASLWATWPVDQPATGEDALRGVLDWTEEVPRPLEPADDPEETVAEVAVAVPVAPPSAPAPRPVAAPPPRKGPPPLGRWVGAFNGRPAVFDLHGSLDAVRGTVTVRFGENEVVSEVEGVFDAERRLLELRDAAQTIDAGRYEAVLAPGGSSLEGRFEGVQSGRLAMFSLKAAP